MCYAESAKFILAQVSTVLAEKYQLHLHLVFDGKGLCDSSYQDFKT